MRRGSNAIHGEVVSSDHAVGLALAEAERIVHQDALAMARGEAAHDRMLRVLELAKVAFHARRAALVLDGDTPFLETIDGRDATTRGVVPWNIALGLGTARFVIEREATDARFCAEERAALGVVAQRLALLALQCKADGAPGTAQRFEALGRLAGGVAHGFANALTAIRGCVEFFASEAEATSPTRPLAVRALQSIDFAGAITRQLLDFSRGGTRAERITLDAAIRRIDQLLHTLLGAGRRLVLVLSDDTPAVCAVPAALGQVVLNLVANARDALPEGGTVEITTGVALVGERRFAVLRVRDDGLGIAASELPRVFEPLFTTKPAGTGLGLATVRSVITALGGSIEVDSAPGAGATFTIRIPAADGAATP
ncbi:MAG: hypothetical protein HZB39_08300 [Planctomycetes bacterium]|nr:hypothetical protein [Planctomycetota bacterium]